MHPQCFHNASILFSVIDIKNARRPCSGPAGNLFAPKKRSKITV
jgi:hypothetical protein